MASRTDHSLICHLFPLYSDLYLIEVRQFSNFSKATIYMDPLYWSMILVALGVGVVLLELFVPSAGVLGIVAAILFISGIATGYFHSVWLGTTMLGLIACCLPLLFMLMVKIWPSTPLGRRILIGRMKEEEVMPVGEEYEHEKLIGQKGIAKTKMLPSGMIKIGDQTYDAVSDGFAIEAGTEIKVVAIKMNRILVQPIDPKTDVADFSNDDLLSQPFEELGIDPIDPLEQ